MDKFISMMWLIVLSKFDSRYLSEYYWVKLWNLSVEKTSCWGL